MRVEHRGHDAILRFACDRDECDGSVEVWIPREEGDYSNLSGTCRECDAEQELGVSMSGEKRTWCEVKHVGPEEKPFVYKVTGNAGGENKWEYLGPADLIKECPIDEFAETHGIDPSLLKKRLELVRVEDDDAEYTGPSTSGLRSGRGTGLLRRLFRDD